MNIYMLVLAIGLLIFGLVNWSNTYDYQKHKYVIMSYICYCTNYAAIINGTAIICNELFKLFH